MKPKNHRNYWNHYKINTITENHWTHWESLESLRVKFTLSGFIALFRRFFQIRMHFLKYVSLEPMSEISAPFYLWCTKPNFQNDGQKFPYLFPFLLTFLEFFSRSLLPFKWWQRKFFAFVKKSCGAPHDAVWVSEGAIWH